MALVVAIPSLKWLSEQEMTRREQEANDFFPHESLTQHLANSRDTAVFPIVSSLLLSLRWLQHL